MRHRLKADLVLDAQDKVDGFRRVPPPRPVGYRNIVGLEQLESSNGFEQLPEAGVGSWRENSNDTVRLPLPRMSMIFMDAAIAL